jgi:hypothetical protein
MPYACRGLREGPALNKIEWELCLQPCPGRLLCNRQENKSLTLLIVVSGQGIEQSLNAYTQIPAP